MLTMNSNGPRRGSDRGAILIQTAISIVALMGLSAFVLDYGVMWVSRRQAQNAADAGALAGATARALDEPTTGTPAPGGVTELSAVAAATNNPVFGAVPGVPSPTYNCPPSAIGGTTGLRCVQIDVFRDGTNGSATLPTFLANVFGQTFQRVRATATAQAAAANSSRCLKPWMIPDLGYTLADVGSTITVSPGDPKTALPVGLTVALNVYYPMQLDNNPGGATATYQQRIEQTCATPVDKGIDPPNSGRGHVLTFPGVDGTTTGGFVSNLILSDSGAYWDGTRVVGSNAAKSPRIVAVALFNPSEYPAARNPSGSFLLTIVNILPFFVQSVAGGAVTGIIVSDTAELSRDNPTPGSDSAFVTKVMLVR